MSLPVHALTIAIGQASKGRWYVGTLELQLASFDICIACRDVPTLRVIVGEHTPLSLWGGVDSIGESCQTPVMRQVPNLRAASLVWKMPLDVLVRVLSESVLLRGVRWMRLRGMSERHSSEPTVCRGDDWLPLGSQLGHSARSYFEAMRSLDGGKDHAVNATQTSPGVSQPATVEKLLLACTLTGTADCVVFPTSLESLILDCSFNQVTETVAWPLSL